MKALIQRVKKASVSIDGALYSSIGTGILTLLCVEKGDDISNVQNLAKKLVSLRIFEDENEKMNKSLLDIGGEMLIVSQFTLAADCKKGTRPSFDKAAAPDVAKDLYHKFVEQIKQHGIKVETGKFQATMDVELINDGPVTFTVEK